MASLIGEHKEPMARFDKKGMSSGQRVVAKCAHRSETWSPNAPVLASIAESHQIRGACVMSDEGTVVSRAIRPCA